MAHAAIEALDNWNGVLRSQVTPLSLKKVKERFSVLPPVDWESEDGQRLLQNLCGLLHRQPPALNIYMKILDELERVGALPAAWGLTFPSRSRFTREPLETCLTWGLLKSAPPIDRCPVTTVRKWQDRMVEGLLNLPEDPALCQRILNLLVDREFGSLVAGGHEVVAQAALRRWPDMWTAEGSHGMWLQGHFPATVWAWALDQGMDPMTIMPGSPVPKALWRRAAEQDCLPAARWGRDHDSQGWEKHCAHRYFLSFEKVSPYYRSTEHYVNLLRRREDWPTLCDERGRSALWQACHHALCLISGFGLAAHLRVPGWQACTDELGRNLAFAVLASPDSNTANDARGEGLRWLHQHGVSLAQDRLGRGLMISCPQLVSIPKLAEVAATYPWPGRWWAGTDEQVALAVQQWANESLTHMATCEQVMDQVPPDHPYLCALHVLLKASHGERTTVAPSARLPEGFPMDSTLGRRLARVGTSAEVVALLRHTTAPTMADRPPARPRRRS